MGNIVKGKGLTSSEVFLAKLAEGTFLNLWSYPNVYREKIRKNKIVGKELCDLLVVCGDDVLIFSDKHIAWPDRNDVNLAWSRWFKKAIITSINQVRGATRWIQQFPDKLYIDPKCAEHLPLQLPPEDRRRIHGIVIANGAVNACTEYYSGGLGSLFIKPDLSGSDHIKPAAKEYQPFAIGDIDNTKPFIHVMNEVSLEIAMRELDTISDFTRYLNKKEKFIRSGRLGAAEGEEDLVAYFMTHMNEVDEHDFAHPEDRPWRENDRIIIAKCFRELVSN